MSDDILARLRQVLAFHRTDDPIELDAAALRDAIATIEQLRKDVAVYHRRAQQAEAAIVAKHGNGPSMGRSLANAGYQHWKERAETAEAAIKSLDAEIERLREHLRVRHRCDFGEPDLPDYFDIATEEPR